MPPKNKENPPDQGKFRAANDYLRYSGLAFQMGIIIGAGAWLGVWLDGRWATGRIFTVIGSLLGVSLSLYQLLREVLSESPPNKKN